MGRYLYEADESARVLFGAANAALGYDLQRLILEGPEEELRRTMHTQPAILLVSVALYNRLGVVPSAAAGHSLGEYSAYVASGALQFADAIVLVHKRGRYMQEAVPEGNGLMLALLGVEREAVEQALAEVPGTVDIANVNAPGQIVIAGEREATRAAAARSGARQVVELPVSAPFHCRLMAPAEERLAADLEATPFRDPQFPVYRNVDARRVTTAEEAREGLRLQVSRPVLWTDVIRNMIDREGIEMFVEVGPGAVLTGLIRRIDRKVGRRTVNDLASADRVRAELRDGASA